MKAKPLPDIDLLKSMFRYENGKNYTRNLRIMDKQLKLCLLATNPNAPSPVASCVKVEDGHMVAYGGQFAIKVPVDHDIGAVFNPRALATFFRKPRTKVAYTIKFPKLTVSEGKERLTIGCLKPEDMPIIDNIETPVPCNLDLEMLKQAASITDVDGLSYAHGVTFRDGMMMSTNNKAFFCGSCDIGDFTIHRDAALALCRFKSKVVALARNNHTAKFCFEDGSSLCAHLLVAEFPNINPLFEGEWEKWELKESVKDLDCDSVEVIGGELRYHTKDTVGILEGVVSGDVHFRVSKKLFDLLDGDTYFDGNKLKGVGDGWCVICSTQRL